MAITEELIHSFLKLAGERLEGDWVILGGSVLPLLGINYRVTIDIDIGSCLPDVSQKQILILMEIAEKLGLPVESVNQ
ncbi:MAG: hypothetical protein HQK54_18040, partial [Oligoflexales bacterium]|nr:hypothetical protein [Oligoflexales bacterium]